MPIFRGVPAASEFQDTTVNELEELIEQEAEARQAGDATLQSNIDLKADKANPVFTGTFDVQSSNGAYIDLNDAAVSGTVESGLRLLMSGNNNNDFEVLNTGAALTFSSGADVITSPTERMRLTSSGSLLVGSTSNPFNSKVYIDGQKPATIKNGWNNTTARPSIIAGQDDFAVHAEGAFPTSDDGFLRVSAGGGFDPTTKSFIDLSGFSTQTEVSRNIVLGTSGVERMRLTRQGYLKADPSGSYKDQSGNSAANQLWHQFNSASTDTVVAYGESDGTSSYYSGLPSTSFANHFAGVRGGAVTFRVQADGTVSNSNGVIAAGSDIKLKENITDATPKLDDITALRFVNFDLKDNPDLGKQFGVIAQEIEEVFPNLVINTPDTEKVETTDEEGNTVTETVETGTVTKSVKYSVLTLMAVKALQELKTEKDELEAKHEELIDEVDILRQRIEALESN